MPWPRLVIRMSRKCSLWSTMNPAKVLCCLRWWENLVNCVEALLCLDKIPCDHLGKCSVLLFPLTMIRYFYKTFGKLLKILVIQNRKLNFMSFLYLGLFWTRSMLPGNGHDNLFKCIFQTNVSWIMLPTPILRHIPEAKYLLGKTGFMYLQHRLSPPSESQMLRK